MRTVTFMYNHMRERLRQEITDSSSQVDANHTIELDAIRA